jgi:hypothetical protein
MEFIRRFLQHVLPTGFMKVRYCGLLIATADYPRSRSLADRTPAASMVIYHRALSAIT